MKNNIYKNLKTWLAITLIAGSLIGVNKLRADNTNAPNLQIEPANTNLTITVSPTSPTRMYSLQEKTNLYDSAWNEVDTLRGTESNLIFDVNTELPQKFFKAKSNYEPLEPTSTFQHFYLSYEIAQRSEGPGTTVSNNLPIVNYETNNIDVNVVWNETYNQYWNSDYDVNTPFDKTLVLGTNYIPFVFVWRCNDGGAVVDGDVYINRAE